MSRWMHVHGRLDDPHPETRLEEIEISVGFNEDDLIIYTEASIRSRPGVAVHEAAIILPVPNMIIRIPTYQGGM